MTDKPQESKSAADMLRAKAAEAAKANAQTAATADTKVVAVAQTPRTVDADVKAAAEHQKAIEAQQLEEHNDKYPQKYQLPSAPCTITFKDRESGMVYRRIFADGVARAETENEHRKLEQMVKSRCCYYYRGIRAQDSRQKMPDPVVAAEQG